MLHGGVPATFVKAYATNAARAVSARLILLILLVCGCPQVGWSNTGPIATNVIDLKSIWNRPVD
jgi:hypothetical protein